jgi:hypothetical protein
MKLTTSELADGGWAVPGSRTPQPGAQESRARNARRGASFVASPLFAVFGGGEAVDPLVGLGAGELTQRLADAALETGDTVLAPELLGEGS